MARVTAGTQQPPKRPRLDFGAKVQAHTRYVAADGKQVPGVTTIAGILNKELTDWANNLGLQGISSEAYLAEAQQMGNLAHYLIECQLVDQEPELGDFSGDQIKRVEQSSHLYQLWRQGKTLEAELVEGKLVSEEHRYGGTVDFYGLLDGVPTLLDYKTSGNIYREHKVQVLGGYWGLLKENGYPVKGIRILRLPYDGSGHQEYVATGQEVLRYWEIFKRCRELYELLRGLK
ncbi:MAG: hypothetical protein DLM66_00015 [Candidatus Dormiibacter spiritus]|nr:MAG: hypothetical protein DLM66_00015 [Candidatus Dormibacteraeota bacterium]